MTDKKELQEGAKKAAQKIDKLKEEGFKQAHSIFNIICEVGKNVFVVTKTLLGKLFFFFNALPEKAKKRLISGIVLVFGFAVIVSLGHIIYTIGIFACGCLMIYELIKMLDNIKDKSNRTFILLRRWGIIYIAICCLSIILVRNATEQGLKITWWMFITVYSVDTFAYIFGKKYGKLQLAPKISPNKTYEGAILGSFCAFFISMLLYKAFGTYSEEAFSGESFAIFSIIVIILAQMGDLSESAIKRQCGVKDSGTLIPGHGGVFDRLDSMLIVAPFVYIILFLNGGVLF